MKLTNIKRWNICFGTKCNLHCSYCWEKYFKRQDFLLANDFILNLKQTLNNSSNSPIVRYYGGEPLLYKKLLYKFIPYFKEYKQNVITNGTLLDKKTVDICNQYNVSITLSNDGELSKLNRNIDVFNDTNLTKLIQKIKWLDISNTCTDNNYDCKSIKQYYDTKLQRNDINYYFNYACTHTKPNPLLYDNFIQALGGTKGIHDKSVKNNLEYNKNYLDTTGSYIGIYLSIDNKIHLLTSDDIIGYIDSTGAYLDDSLIKKVLTRRYDICNMYNCNHFNLCKTHFVLIDKYTCALKNNARDFVRDISLSIY